MRPTNPALAVQPFPHWILVQRIFITRHLINWVERKDPQNEILPALLKGCHRNLISPQHSLPLSPTSHKPKTERKINNWPYKSIEKCIDWVALDPFFPNEVMTELASCSILPSLTAPIDQKKVDHILLYWLNQNLDHIVEDTNDSIYNIKQKVTDLLFPPEPSPINLFETTAALKQLQQILNQDKYNVLRQCTASPITFQQDSEHLPTSGTWSRIDRAISAAIEKLEEQQNYPSL